MRQEHQIHNDWCGSELKVVIWKDNMKTNLGNSGICLYQLHVYVPKICFYITTSVL